MEMKVIKCPNCGANAKNHTNCEYCGSLLVRFVDKGIEIKGTSYIDNSMVFPGLLEELEKNIEYQKEGRDATTSILFQDKLGDNIGYYSGMHIENMKDGIEPNLSVGFTFIDVPGSEVKKIHDLRITRLSLLKSFPLFEKEVSTDEEDGCLYRYYYLNMGQDAEGAARLISEILIRVQEISINEPVFAYTYYDDEEDGDGYDKVFADWCRKNGLPVEGEPTNENSENVDDESDYSEDQEENSIDSLRNWQKVLLAFSLISGVLVGYYVISENLLELGFLWVLIILGPTICAFIPHNYEADIERGEGVINPRNKWVTVVVFIISLISIIFICPSLLKQMESNDSPNTEHLKEETSDAEVMKQEKVTDGSQSSENNNPKKSKLEEIKELGYNDGVKFGYSDRGEALRDYVQMGTTLENGLSHIQNVIARTAYKEDYGDNISEALLDEYCKQFIEGYKSIVIKK